MSSNGIDVYASASLRRLDFPRFGFPTRSTYSGWRVDNPYQELGLLGRIVVHDLTGSQCLVSLEVAGDPEDPMTDCRLAVFEPVAKDLVRRLELHSGRIEAALGTAPPVTPLDAAAS